MSWSPDNQPKLRQRSPSDDLRFAKASDLRKANDASRSPILKMDGRGRSRAREIPKGRSTLLLGAFLFILVLLMVELSGAKQGSTVIENIRNYTTEPNGVNKRESILKDRTESLRLGRGFA
jgi:hypothetical protein